MKGKKGTQRRCPPIPPLESLFRDNHYSLLAMPRDTLGFAAERALDELGELGPCLVQGVGFHEYHLYRNQRVCT